MVADHTHHLGGERAGTPFVEQNVEAVVVFGYRNEYARQVIHRTQVEAHLEFVGKLLETLAKLLEGNRHLPVVKHTAQVERLADRVRIVGNLGDERSRLKQQTGRARDHAQPVRALEGQ